VHVERKSAEMRECLSGGDEHSSNFSLQLCVVCVDGRQRLLVCNGVAACRLLLLRGRFDVRRSSCAVSIIRVTDFVIHFSTHHNVIKSELRYKRYYKPDNNA
jgi:hypothetical protein